MDVQTHLDVITLPQQAVTIATEVEARHRLGSSSSSTRSSGTDLGQYDGALLIGGVIVLVVVCWAVIDPDSCCLFDASHSPDAAHRYLNQLPMRIPVNIPLVPRFNLTRQEHAGWEFRASYTFRF